jgi:hypothetical protein
LLQRSSGYFEGPWELEDNDSYQQANGPLRLARDYYGYPDDQKDFFSIYLPSPGQLSIDVTNHSGSGVQLQLFNGSVDNRVCFDPELPLHCEYTGQAGWYYVFIYTESGFNTHTAYTLRAEFP